MTSSFIETAIRDVRWHVIIGSGFAVHVSEALKEITHG